MADTLRHSQANVPTFYVGNLLPITPCVGWPEPSERHLAAIRNPDVRGRHFGHVVLKDDEHGNEVRLTDERLRHILRRHPEMALQMHRFAETLASPKAVRPSMSGPSVQLYYPALPGPAGQEPLHLPCGEEGEGLLPHPHRLPGSKHQRRVNMASRKVFVSYDHEGDMLEVLWAFREGYFTPTDDERILKRLDDDGEVIGFLIHEMSTLKEPSPVEFELASEAPAVDVANVTAREAANRLGVSERRVRKLARDGRMRGAIKTGAEWLIPTPVEVIPGKRGPVGVAGRADAVEG